MSCPLASRTVRTLMAAVCVAVTVSTSHRAWGQPEATLAVAEARDVLAAEAEGLAEVKFIANDARSAQVVVANRGDRPLTLRLPAAFAGVPVLAQQAAGAGFGAGGINAPPQNVGGGGMQNAGMGIGGAQGGNPFCWVAREVYGVQDPRWFAFRQWMVWSAPAWLQELYLERGEDFAGWLHERPAAKAGVRLAMDQVIAADCSGPKDGGLFRVVTTAPDAFTKPFTVAAGATVAVKFPTVCLEYGKRDPTARMPYRLTAFEKVSQDPRVALILGGLASGHLSQNVAQAAAWHLASGRTWEQLAAEVIDRAGGDPDLPVFSAAELAAARQAVDVAARLTAERPAAKSTAESAGR